MGKAKLFQPSSKTKRFRTLCVRSLVSRRCPRRADGRGQPAQGLSRARPRRCVQMSQRSASFACRHGLTRRGSGVRRVAPRPTWWQLRGGAGLPRSARPSGRFLAPNVRSRNLDGSGGRPFGNRVSGTARAKGALSRDASIPVRCGRACPDAPNAVDALKLAVRGSATSAACGRLRICRRVAGSERRCRARGARRRGCRPPTLPVHVLPQMNAASVHRLGTLLSEELRKLLDDAAAQSASPRGIAGATAEQATTPRASAAGSLLASLCRSRATPSRPAGGTARRVGGALPDAGRGALGGTCRGRREGGAQGRRACAGVGRPRGASPAARGGKVPCAPHGGGAAPTRLPRGADARDGRRCGRSGPITAPVLGGGAMEARCVAASAARRGGGSRAERASQIAAAAGAEHAASLRRAAADAAAREAERRRCEGRVDVGVGPDAQTSSDASTCVSPSRLRAQRAAADREGETRMRERAEAELRALRARLAEARAESGARARKLTNWRRRLPARATGPRRRGEGRGGGGEGRGGGGESGPRRIRGGGRRRAGAGRDGGRRGAAGAVEAKAEAAEARARGAAAAAEAAAAARSAPRRRRRRRRRRGTRRRTRCGERAGARPGTAETRAARSAGARLAGARQASARRGPGRGVDRRGGAPRRGLDRQRAAAERLQRELDHRFKTVRRVERAGASRRRREGAVVWNATSPRSAKKRGVSRSDWPPRPRGPPRRRRSFALWTRGPARSASGSAPRRTQRTRACLRWRRRRRSSARRRSEGWPWSVASSAL